MHINAPDSYPGRCKNFRQVGPYENARCLGEEMKPHICKFPAPMTTINDTLSVYTPSEPKPWISQL